MRNFDDENIHANVISLAVEKALLDFGIPVLQKVEEILKTEYQMNFSDSINHPDKISHILYDVFGNSYIEVAKKIEVNLRDINFNPKSEEFLRVINNAIRS